MARMHSRKHGKHGSTKPIKKIKVGWLIYDKDEVENLVLKLAKEDKSSSQIGAILRDQYGIPDVRHFSLRVAKITAREYKKEVPEDLYSLIKKAVNLHRHMQEKRKDMEAKHGLQLVESTIRRLGKYYSRTGKLPKGWKYNIEEAKLLVK